jgi:ABC-2 type transport system ATP-binding protein
MSTIVEIHSIKKHYGAKSALNGLSMSIADQRVVGLIGQNGSGKTTLLDIISGATLPSEGSCITLGVDSRRLPESILARIGVVFQENRFLDWMRVEQHLKYFGSFYPTWDVARQNRLLTDLDLDPRAKVGHLSGGDVQKLGIITAVCHHPELLLLDEPLSSLDPIARESLLNFILRLLDEDDVTIIVSSHALMDVERLVNWVICLDDGKLRANSALDDLQERFATWEVTSQNGSLPAAFTEPFVRQQNCSGRLAHLVVENADLHLDAFCATHHVEVSVGQLNLEKIYPFLLERKS